MKLPRAALRHIECSSPVKVGRRQPQIRAAAAQSLRPPAAFCSGGVVVTSSSAKWHNQQPSSPLLISRLPGAHRGYATTTVSAAELEFGQPVHETHPHLLKPGEITPGISAQEYDDRRAALALSLSAVGDVAVLAAADLKYRSGAVFFPFRQESNFLYLTGFLEPEAVAVITKTGSELGDFSFTLFCRPKDPQAELWNGPWSGLQAAEDVFNAHESADIAKLDAVLPQLLRGAGRVYSDIELNVNSAKGRQQSAPAIAAAAVISHHVRGGGGSSNNTTRPLQALINNLRAIKSPAEVANMRRAGQVSGRAITSAMRQAWTREKDLQSFLEYEFTKHGCDGPAYVPVVAGASRGCMIHYVHNTASLTPGTMVLVDAGGEYGSGYVSDITRTWPVNGRCSVAQRDLYSAVLSVQRTGVSLCRASAGMTLDQVHRVAEAGLREQLAQLGFDLSGDAMDVLFPHHVGHYVGLDVHDVPGYSRSVALRAGHCVTVEPGIYVPDDERWPKHFRGMAIRIEDSVCVEDDSPLNLTVEAVKEVVDIEALRD
ncbi:peptidase M24, structural domain-containing protein [Podospora didyma]|uniref:Xaa-Pro aminopeptidase n=1 Tax=Podospora didyma TaxID=330526 RepID=A0AAE0TVY1_9PEZI|nr:peptidase M24, structural domain-containing protein [Podospora didyma]